MGPVGASTPIRDEWIQGDGIRLHVLRAGNGSPVILLHGFPEDARTWKHQIPALLSAGFSILAADLRGYGRSDRPTAPGAYHMKHLVADVARLVRATGHERTHVVGHDWGGVLAWAFAGSHPELVDKLVILNAPHIDIFERHLRRPSRQWLRSWYTVLFRIPWLAERLLSMGNYHLIRSLFRDRPALPAYSTEDINGYIETLAQPGALTAALRWYRDNAAADAVQLSRSARVAGPALVIWGERDTTLGLELLDGLERVAPLVRVHRIPGASHWVQNEAPGEVNRVMIDFLSPVPHPPGSALH
jgi:pimeloyl-ACP methyl ester carboxylesterase